jgi:hypothetical protein
VQHALRLRKSAPELEVVTIGFSGRLISRNGDAGSTRLAGGRHAKIMTHSSILRVDDATIVERQVSRGVR